MFGRFVESGHPLRSVTDIPRKYRHSRAGLTLRCRSNSAGRGGECDEERVALVSTSTPPWRPNASRSTRRCSTSASAYRSAPSSCSSRDDPSTSENKNVTVPRGNPPTTQVKRGAAPVSSGGLAPSRRETSRTSCGSSYSAARCERVPATVFGGGRGASRRAEDAADQAPDHCRSRADLARAPLRRRLNAHWSREQLLKRLVQVTRRRRLTLAALTRGPHRLSAHFVRASLAYGSAAESVVPGGNTGT